MSSTLTPPAPATVLGRTARAEWTRLWTVRSTWWFALATVTVVVGIGLLLGIDVQDDPETMRPHGTAWRAGQITSVFGLYGLLVLAVVAVTADHATGGIVPTMQATPRRGLLVTARTAVVAGLCVVLGVAVVAVSCVVVHGFVPDMGLPAGAGGPVLGATAVVYAAGCLLAVGLGLLARNTAGTLVTVLGLMLVLPMMLAMMPFDWASDVAVLLPGTGALRVLTGEGVVPMSEAAGYVSCLTWAGAAVVAGTARMLRTDAGH